MKRLALLTCAFLIFALPAQAVDHQKKYLDPWKGATKQELISKWGYPERGGTREIDDETEVLTYESSASWAPRGSCRISFTLRSGVVMLGRFQGGHCHFIRRDPDFAPDVRSLTIELKKDLFSRLHDVAKKSDRSVSDIVAEALAAHLD